MLGGRRALWNSPHFFEQTFSLSNYEKRPVLPQGLAAFLCRFSSERPVGRPTSETGHKSDCVASSATLALVPAEFIEEGFLGKAQMEEQRQSPERTRRRVFKFSIMQDAPIVALPTIFVNQTHGRPLARNDAVCRLADHFLNIAIAFVRQALVGSKEAIQQNATMKLAFIYNR